MRGRTIVTGEKFGEWTVSGDKLQIGDKVYCQCSCGEFRFVRLYLLRTGRSKSCGHWRSPVGVKKGNYKFYHIWQCIKQRCDNPKDTNYKKYGAKGIGYDERWKSSKNFYDDMFDGYRDGLTIDRIDPSKGYSKENCRWATYTEQNRHRSNTVFLVVNGVKKTLTEFSEEYGISSSTVRSRIRSGKGHLEALTQKIR